jgi:DNA-binding transcriptional LysR family regulator
VDDSTVARRLSAIQETIGTRLYQRFADGTLQLTNAGERVAGHAERVEREIDALQATVAGADSAVSGTVRVTSVPIIVNHVLVPAASRLIERHPQLNLELLADPRDLSLTHRETDLALRLARPTTGGTRVTARHVGSICYDVYVSTACTTRDAKLLPWITYEKSMAQLPQARWIAALAADKGRPVAAMRVNDAEALLEGVAAGLGRSLLPCFVADQDPRVRRVTTDHSAPPVNRELWLLSSAEHRGLRRIEAVIGWIEQVVPRQ